MATNAGYTFLVLMIACWSIVKFYGDNDPGDTLKYIVVVVFVLSFFGLIGSMIWKIWS